MVFHGAVRKSQQGGGIRAAARRRKGLCAARLVEPLLLRLDISRRLIFGPWIVSVSKHQALGKRRVRIHPERNECWRIGIGEIAGKPVMLAQPQTFMNLSGTSVKPLMEKHELTPTDLVAVWDELNLPWGGLKIMQQGSAGGHNGAESLIGSLGTREFVRVRLGVHPGRPLASGMDYLLAPVKRSQKQEWEELIGRGAEAVATIISEGAAKAMTKFNRRAQGSNEEE